MKITRSDKQALIIVDFPYLIAIAGYPLAASCIVASVANFYRTGLRSETGWTTACIALLAWTVATVFFKRSEFHFDFVARELRWKRRGIFTNKSGVVPLDQIRSASVAVNYSSDGDTTQPVINTAAGVLPIIDASTSNTRRHRMICDAINQALGTPADESKN